MGDVQNLKEEFQLINKYDNDGNLVLHMATDGTRREYEYDTRGNLIRFYDAKEDFEEVNKYDEKDRLISSSNSRGDISEMEYIENPYSGKLMELRTRIANTNTNTFYMDIQIYEYFQDGSYKITYISDHNKTKTETYDADGNLILADYKKFTKIYEYENDRKTKEINSLGVEERWIYNDDGNILCHYVKRNGKVAFKCDYTYNEKGQLIEENNINGNHVEYIYDKNGNNTRIVYNRGVYYRDIEYDDLGRKTKVTTPNSIKTFQYDCRNRLIKFTKRKVKK